MFKLCLNPVCDSKKPLTCVSISHPVHKNNFLSPSQIWAYFSSINYSHNKSSKLITIITLITILFKNSNVTKFIRWGHTKFIRSGHTISQDIKFHTMGHTKFITMGHSIHYNGETLSSYDEEVKLSSYDVRIHSVF